MTYAVLWHTVAKQSQILVGLWADELGAGREPQKTEKVSSKLRVLKRRGALSKGGFYDL